jgi:hypothetical protein
VSRGALLRLVAFGVALLLVFGAATAVGVAVGPLERGQRDHGPTRGHGDTSAVLPDGLSIAANGFRLVPGQTRLVAGMPQRLGFRILSEDQRPLRDYEVRHERRLHLIVVRRDLTAFQHLHARLTPDGAWISSPRPLVPGTYRALADFSSAGRTTVLGFDVFVPGRSSFHPLPAPVSQTSAGGYAVQLNTGELKQGKGATLVFRVSRRGRPIQPDPYLDAHGHLVVLRAGDLGYVHTHAEEAALEFKTTFPSAGRYRAFLEFRHAGRVRTVAFTLGVRR